MFDIHCHICEERYLVESHSITSFHNTSEGPVAYVTCPEGHRLVRYFRIGAADEVGVPALQEAS